MPVSTQPVELPTLFKSPILLYYAVFTSVVTGVHDEMEEELLVLYTLLCYAMFSVVIVCAGENERRP